MDWKLEVVPVPVDDIDRALAFYRDLFGFAVDLDDQVSDEVRLVQLTPPGSGCSIHLDTTDMPPGSLRGLQIVVDDIAAARADLLGPRRARSARSAISTPATGSTDRVAAGTLLSSSATQMATPGCFKNAGNA